MNYNKMPISDILRSKNTIFTFKDILLVWGNIAPKNAISSINYHIKTGKLYRVRKGIYAKEKNYDQFELAVKIYTPSYISFETVLKKAGVIFQYYSQIFIASYLTREININNQSFSLKKIKDTALTNKAGIEIKDNYSIASPERAFLDTVYLNKDYHFDNLSGLSKEKIFEILPIYNNQRMAKKVNEYLKNI